MSKEFNGKKAVVVEDNRINAQLFVDLLELNGIQAHALLNGNEAFTYIEKNPVDLIVMDIQLQDISGIDIIRELKANDNLSRIPVIAVTAFASQQDESKIMTVGCDAYISKPISIDHFMNIVNQLLNQHYVENE